MKQDSKQLQSSENFHHLIKSLALYELLDPFCKKQAETAYVESHNIKQDIHELRSDERANRLALGASHVRPERLRAVVRRKRFEQPPPVCGIKLEQASLDQDAVFISWSDLSKRGERWIIAKPFCLETRF